MELVHRGPVRDHREQGSTINHADEQHAPQGPLSNDGRPEFFVTWIFMQGIAA